MANQLMTDVEQIEVMYKGLFASIKIELVNTQHFIDHLEVMGKPHPDCEVSYDLLKRYREFLHWWLRKIDIFKRSKDLDKIIPWKDLPTLSVFENSHSPIPH